VKSWRSVAFPYRSLQLFDHFVSLFDQHAGGLAHFQPGAVGLRDLVIVFDVPEQSVRSEEEIHG
jgi:hypothetical protein